MSKEHYVPLKGGLMNKRKSVNPYAINCPTCKRQWCLTLQDYQKQLDNKERGWICPNCQNNECSFDEENYKKVMGLYRTSLGI